MENVEAQKTLVFRKKSGRPLSLRKEEEYLVLDLIQHYISFEITLRRADIAVLIEKRCFIIANLSPKIRPLYGWKTIIDLSDIVFRKAPRIYNDISGILLIYSCPVMHSGCRGN